MSDLEVIPMRTKEQYGWCIWDGYAVRAGAGIHMSGGMPIFYTIGELKRYRFTFHRNFQPFLDEVRAKLGLTKVYAWVEGCNEEWIAWLGFSKTQTVSDSMTLWERSLEPARTSRV